MQRRMSKYIYKTAQLENNGRSSTVIKDERLLFQGDSYVAIMIFINACNNAPEVIKWFKPQLEQREHAKHMIEKANERR